MWVEHGQCFLSFKSVLVAFIQYNSCFAESRVSTSKLFHCLILSVVSTCAHGLFYVVLHELF